jgi:hypothetical protein
MVATINGYERDVSFSEATELGIQSEPELLHIETVAEHEEYDPEERHDGLPLD